MYAISKTDTINSINEKKIPTPAPTTTSNRSVPEHRYKSYTTMRITEGLKGTVPPTSSCSSNQLRMRRPFELKYSKSLKKKTGLTQLKTKNGDSHNDPHHLGKGKNILIEKPFPLLKVLSSYCVLNNSKTFMKNLIEPVHVPSVNTIFRNKVKEDTNKNNYIHRVGVGVITHKREDNNLMVNSLALDSLSSRSALVQTINLKLDLTKTKLVPTKREKAFITLSNSSRINTMYKEPQPQPQSDIIIPNPKDNYSRNAYRMIKFIDEESFTNKIKKHISRIKKSGSISISTSNNFPQYNHNQTPLHTSESTLPTVTNRYENTNSSTSNRSSNRKFNTITIF
jgi:hypothetical protein